MQQKVKKNSFFYLFSILEFSIIIQTKKSFIQTWEKTAYRKKIIIKNNYWVFDSPFVISGNIAEFTEQPGSSFRPFRAVEITR